MDGICGIWSTQKMHYFESVQPNMLNYASHSYCHMVSTYEFTASSPVKKNTVESLHDRPTLATPVISKYESYALVFF